jgi:hypothetical protein
VTDETKKWIERLALVLLTAVVGWLANLLNPTPAPVNPTPVNVVVESKPGVFAGPTEVKVQHVKE